MQKKKLSNRKLILLSLLVVALLILFTGVLWALFGHNQEKARKASKNYIVSSQNKNEKYNVSTALKGDHFISDYRFKDIELYSYDGFTTFSMKVVNQGDKDLEEQTFQVVFLTKEKKKIATIPIIVPALKAKEENEIFSYTLLDVMDAYDFKFVKEET